MGGAHVIDAVQEAAGHVDGEHEDEAEAEDDDGVEVGGGEGGLQAPDGRVHHHSDRDQEAHCCTAQGVWSGQYAFFLMCTPCREQVGNTHEHVAS